MPDPRQAFNTLVGLHLRDLRGQFTGLALFTVMVPLVLVLGVHALPPLPTADGQNTPIDAASLEALGIVAALSGSAWVVVPQQMARMRTERLFTFFSGFAVGQGTYLLALLTAFGVVTVPGIVLVPVVAAYALHMPLTLHPAMLAAVGLGFAGLTATGGVLGLLRLSAAVTTALTVTLYLGSLSLLTLLSLGLVSGNAHTLALIAPSALAGDVLHAATVPGSTNTVVADVLGLLAYIMGGGYLATRLLPWRAKSSLPQAGG